MIEITYYSLEDFISRLTVSGHAQSVKSGPDILCAAVSTIAANLADGLEVLVKAPISVTAENGYIDIRLTDMIKDEKIDLLFNSAILGFDSLRTQHPDRIRIVSGD